MRDTVLQDVRREHALALEFHAARYELGHLFRGEVLISGAGRGKNLDGPSSDRAGLLEEAVDAFDMWCDEFADKHKDLLGQGRADTFRLADSEIESDRSVLDALSKRASMVDALREDEALFPLLLDAQADVDGALPSRQDLLAQLAGDHEAESQGAARIEVLAALGAKHIAVSQVDSYEAARTIYAS